MEREYILCLLIDNIGLMRRFNVKLAATGERVVHQVILGHYDWPVQDDAARQFRMVAFKSEPDLRMAGYGWVLELPPDDQRRECYLIRPTYFPR